MYSLCPPQANKKVVSFSEINESDDELEFLEEEVDVFGTPPVNSWQQTRSSYRQALDSEWFLW